MYPLENQVCTLEQAQEFDKLGLKIESYFVWAVGGIASIPEIWTLKDGKFNKKMDIIDTFYYAYSCAELGVLLPISIHDDKFKRMFIFAFTIFYEKKKIEAAFNIKPHLSTSLNLPV